MKRTVRLLLLFALIAPLLRPATADATGSGFWRTYTTREGLLSNNVQALAYREDPMYLPPCGPQTRSDCQRIPGLWVGTDQGLTYLNGREYEKFGGLTDSDDVRSLLFEPGGRLWIGTAAGLTWLDDGRTPTQKRDDTWLPEAETFLRERQILALARTPDGVLWVGTDEGLFALTAAGEEVRRLLPGRAITALPHCPFALGEDCRIDRNETLWIGTASGLFRLPLNDSTDAPIAVNDFPLADAQISAVTLSTDGLWVGSNRGAALWNGDAWGTVFDGVANLASKDVRGVDLDDQGRVWFATAAGASRWDPTHIRWRRFFASSDGIASDDVRALILDPHGQSWFGTIQGLSGIDGSMTWLSATTTFSTSSPIAADDVWTLLEDSTGQIWVGTDSGGIAVLDSEGTPIRVLTTQNSLLNSDIVSALLEDSGGKIWVGTGGPFSDVGGVTVFNSAGEGLHTLTSQNSPIAEGAVLSLLEDSQDQVWVGTEGGITVFAADGDVVRTLNGENSGFFFHNVSSLIEDSQGQIWVGTGGLHSDGNGVSILDSSGEIVRVLTTQNSALGDDNVLVLLEDSRGQVWVGTASGEVSIFDGEKDTGRIIAGLSGELNAVPVRALLEDSQGQVWVGTGSYWGWTGGVTILDTFDESIHTLISRDKTLFSVPVRALLEDSHGQVWVGKGSVFRDDGGMTIFDANREPVRSLRSSSSVLAEGNSSVFLEDSQGQVWVGTSGGGVTIFDQAGEIVRTLTTPKNTLSFHFNFASTLLEDSLEQVWVGTSGDGVTVFNLKGETVRHLSTQNSGLTDDNVRALLEDSQGQVWVGTSGGGVTIFDLKGETVRHLSTQNSGLTDDNVSALLEDSDEHIWVGTSGGGVTIFDLKGETVRHLPAQNSDLTKDNVRALLEDSQGQVWVGTSGGGVTIFDLKGETVRHLSTQNSGLTDDNVRALLEDSQGQVWVGTSGGGVTIFDLEGKAVRNLSTQNSDLADDNVRALLEDSQGQVWVDTDDRAITIFGIHGEIILVLKRRMIGQETGGSAPLLRDSQGRVWLSTNSFHGVGSGLRVFNATGDNPWIRIKGYIPHPLNILDTNETAFSIEAGSLIVPPLDFAYQVHLLNVEGTVVQTQTLPINSVSTDVRFSGLDYGRYQLNVTVLGSDLQAGGLTAVDITVHASPQLTLLSFDDFTFAEPVGAEVRFENTPNSITIPTISPLPTQVVSPLATHPLSPLSSSDQNATFPSPTTTTPPLPENTPAIVFKSDPISNAAAMSKESVRVAAGGIMPIHWQVSDPDAAVDEVATLQAAWDFSGDIETASWRTVQTTADGSFIQLVSLNRGAADEVRTLALRAVDADGNPSNIITVPVTLEAPQAYAQILAPWLGGFGAVLFLFAVGLVGLSRSSGLPLPLLMRRSPGQWLAVGLGYLECRTRWQGLSPAERLLLLLMADSMAGEDMQRWLTEKQVPLTETQIDSALDTLVRERFLIRNGATYTALVPSLAQALRDDEGEIGIRVLVQRLQQEHPLVALTQRFLEVAGFALQPSAAGLSLVATPTTGSYDQWIEGNVYVRIYPDRVLDRPTVSSLHDEASAISDRTATLFAVINQTPDDSGWIEIGALRAEGIQVVLIDDISMQQARVESREQAGLQKLLRRYLGRQRDLYNVRDPVADRLNFFGRDSLAQEMLEELTSGRPLALLGLRKMGKSSLLQAIRDRASFPVAYVDLQAGVELSSLYGRILNSWQQTLRTHASEISWSPLSQSDDPTAGFVNAVQALMQTLAEADYPARLGLLVDEIELIVPRSESVVGEAELNRYLTFGRTLRGLVQESGNFALLVAGVDPTINRVNRWAEQQNPFYQFFREIYLPPLSRDDTIQMVRNIGRQMGLAYPDEAMALVAETSGGHPFLARQLCSAAFQTHLRETGSEISLDELQTAANKFIRNPATSILLNERGIWGEVTNPDLWLAAQIVENGNVLRLLARKGPQPEDGLMEQATDRDAREASLFELDQRSVLERIEENFDIQFGLFQRWIQRYQLKE